MATKKEVKKSEYEVYDGETYVRTYSYKVHGINAKKLAEQFCKNRNYSIK